MTEAVRNREKVLWKKITSIIKRAAPWIAVAVLIAFLAGLLPVAPSVILTGSMEPGIKPGDLVLIDKTARGSLREGDIIQFKRGNYTVVHRIEKITREEDNQTAYITKGDANNAPDTEAVLEDDVIGRYLFHIPKIGYVPMWLGSLFR